MSTTKVSIVFEESGFEGINAHGRGKQFNVYLEGMTPERKKEIDKMTPEEQLERFSAAEFWALRCFQITYGAMKQAGGLDLRATKGKGSG